MKRTLDNCRLVAKYGRPVQYDGACEGFCRSESDDEPCAACKDCVLHYLFSDGRADDGRKMYGKQR